MQEDRDREQDPSFPFGYTFAENSPLSFRDPSGRSVLLEYACLTKNSVMKALALKPFFVSASLPFYALGIEWTDITPELADAVVEATLTGMGEGLTGFATASGPVGGCGSPLQELVGAYGDLLGLADAPQDLTELIGFIKTLLEIYEL